MRDQQRVTKGGQGTPTILEQQCLADCLFLLAGAYRCVEALIEQRLDGLPAGLCNGCPEKALPCSVWFAATSLLTTAQLRQRCNDLRGSAPDLAREVWP